MPWLLELFLPLFESSSFDRVPVQETFWLVHLPHIMVLSSKQTVNFPLPSTEILPAILTLLLPPSLRIVVMTDPFA